MLHDNNVIKIKKRNTIENKFMDPSNELFKLLTFDNYLNITILH